MLAAFQRREPRFEGLYGSEHTREAQDANLSQSLRFGRLKSFGYYAQVGFWPFGAGILFTWPRLSYLFDHKLPGTRDAVAQALSQLGH